MFHNLENYDSHLIFQDFELFNLNGNKINATRNTIEKYMSFSFPRQLVFIDSIYF